MPRETINPSPTPQEQPFENTPEYRGKCREFFEPRGEDGNETGPRVTLIDGRTGTVTGYRSDLQTESYHFNPEIHIQIDGKERPEFFSLQDIEGWQGQYGSRLSRQEKKD